MIREIVTIDEELCNGCGECVPNCHEGALQMIDGKARLISDLMCDGLGACIGHCPVDAIKIEKREAEAYDEVKVMEIMVTKGINTVIAHMKHLKDHQEFVFLKQAVQFLKQNQARISFDIQQVISTVHNHSAMTTPQHEPKAAPIHTHGGGCPSAREMSFSPENLQVASNFVAQKVQSELRQWPVQMHLINPQASYFQKADVLIAADCVPFAMADFHQKHLRGRGLAIACPKLDDGLDVYRDKITAMIDHAQVNTITVMMMQVPCCGGLLQIVKQAASLAQRKVPIKSIVVSMQGEILSENWV